MAWFDISLAMIEIFQIPYPKNYPLLSLFSLCQLSCYSLLQLRSQESLCSYWLVQGESFSKQLWYYSYGKFFKKKKSNLFLIFYWNIILNNSNTIDPEPQKGSHTFNQF
ncbi:hypothetical protein TTHERM_000441769 (macronuclear) [Tetrahymena thermophila SB210]|uniref:Uncharacterized protein n=1 Tax=Tetrahymena thermophila (strain SB210) TaxID=312017 RepID=W7XC05_TETTS|nr:hypothetical protein TTHERM_000441769 [Tetrahymena thermophila SB210]EWS73988.1 hypothetical protein TTHERM_000441769 [Tetrahymena thermophila SB210]|eukprot:XP_012653450.1 hypothetical protein TTHERM_000441769 [Tetrahymena thermophila SB210]